MKQILEQCHALNRQNANLQLLNEIKNSICGYR